MMNRVYNMLSSARGTVPQGRVRKSDLKKQPFKKKLICPTCRSSKSTIFVYSDEPTSGHISQRCSVCNHLLYIDYTNLTIQDAESK